MKHCSEKDNCFMSFVNLILDCLAEIMAEIINEWIIIYATNFFNRATPMAVWRSAAFRL